MGIRKLGIALVAMGVALPADAGLYKCRKDGQLVFSDVACASVSAQAPRPQPTPQAPPPTPTAAASVAAAPAQPVVPEAAPAATSATPAAPTEVAPAAGTSVADAAAIEAAEAAPVESEDAVAALPLPNGKTQLRLGRGFRYLDPKESERVIEDLWGNPPGTASGVDGMIMPTGMDPEDEESWGVVITYTQDGHVSDTDAAEIDFNALLKDMQESTAAESEEREADGYGAVRLVGWAEPPHYDAASRKLYWAKSLEFRDGREKHSTLNYSIRVLGREGVLELNAVASTDQMFQVKRAMERVVGFAEFTEGNRYADYNEDTDQLAGYGLAALVAGGLAASKKGVIAGLIILALKMKKLLFVVLIPLFALVRKVLAGRRG